MQTEASTTGTLSLESDDNLAVITILEQAIRDYRSQRGLLPLSPQVIAHDARNLASLVQYVACSDLPTPEVLASIDLKDAKSTLAYTDDDDQEYKIIVLERAKRLAHTFVLSNRNTFELRAELGKILAGLGVSYSMGADPKGNIGVALSPADAAHLIVHLQKASDLR